MQHSQERVPALQRHVDLRRVRNYPPLAEPGETLMPVATRATIDAPVDAVWAIVSDFAHLMRWHPHVLSCETTGEGVGAVRLVRFAERWAEERLSLLDADAHVVVYDVIGSDQPEVIGVSGRIALSDLGDGKTRLDWSSGLPDDNPHATIINGQLEAYYPARVEHLKAALRTSP